MIEPLHHFRATLLTYGTTDGERARALGVSLRTFMNYKAGQIPRSLRCLMRPELLRALAMDVEQGGANTLDTD